jgi:hypothetical protein
MQSYYLVLDAEPTPDALFLHNSRGESNIWTRSFYGRKRPSKGERAGSYAGVHSRMVLISLGRHTTKGLVSFEEDVHFIHILENWAE